MNRPRRRDIWKVVLPDARGSEFQGERFLVIIQADFLNGKALKTCLCMPLTGELAYARHRGNVLITADGTNGLPRDWVALPHLTRAVNKDRLTERRGTLDEDRMTLVEGALAFAADLTYASVDAAADLERSRP